MIERGIRCRLLVAGRALPEYIKLHDGHHVEAYVPAIEGDTYEISLLRTQRLPDEDAGVKISAQFSVDGRALIPRIFLPSGESVTFNGPSSSPSTRRPLQFGKLSFQSEGNIDDPNINALGCIRVEIWKVRAGATMRPRFGNPDALSVGEEAVKNSGRLRDIITV
jgi:hypothetical protein